MFPDTLQCNIATTEEQRSRVYHLRYTCYRRKGSIETRPDEQFHDSYDELPNSFSFLASDSACDAMATVRITVVRPDLGWTDSPVTHVYGDHPAFQAIAKESYVEASRLCFGKQARRDAFVKLVGHMAALAEFYGVEWLVACPRVEHSAIYQRMFGFRPLAAPRQYFGVKFETQLLGIRVSELREYVRSERPMVQAWSDALTRLHDGERLSAGTLPAVDLDVTAGLVRRELVPGTFNPALVSEAAAVIRC